MGIQRAVFPFRSAAAITREGDKHAIDFILPTGASGPVGGIVKVMPLQGRPRAPWIGHSPSRRADYV